MHRLSAIAVMCSMVFLVSCDAENASGVSSDAALTADHADCFDGDPGCGPTGAHQKHGSYSCTVCHKFAGRVVFDASGPAYGLGTRPSFNAVTKTCSNVACHGATVAGSFTFWQMGGDGEDYQLSVPYSSDGSSSTPSWYATGTSTCSGCHGYPPTANGQHYPWHSGAHAYTNTAYSNTCQLCHPGETGAYVYGGPPDRLGTTGGLITSCAPGTFCSAPGTIANPSLHGNGVVEVQVNRTWMVKCYFCHGQLP
jgi:predicted CxxxxCH...CXXCH cytochrome family protein